MQRVERTHWIKQGSCIKLYRMRKSIFLLHWLLIGMARAGSHRNPMETCKTLPVSHLHITIKERKYFVNVLMGAWDSGKLDSLHSIHSLCSKFTKNTQYNFVLD